MSTVQETDQPADQGNLGPLITRLRRESGSSVEQAAFRAGVSPSTLRRWEAGEHHPGLLELSAVLDALGASPTDRAEAFARVAHPRALSGVRAALLGSRSGSDDAVAAARSEWMPAAGDLWRALRHRAGLTASDLSARIGVHRSAVTRWEKSEDTPSPERRERLFTLLRPSPEERAALSDPTLLLARPWRELAKPEVWEQRLWDWKARFEQGEAVPGDLYFLSAEAHLWALAAKRPSHACLLSRACAYHAHWLRYQGPARSSEAGEFARRALALSAPDRGDGGTWAEARILQSLYLLETGKGRRRAIKLLEGTLLPFPGPQYRWLRSQVLRTMADIGYPHAPRHAFVWAETAVRLAEEHGDPGFVEGARIVLADLHVSAGNPNEALGLFPPVATGAGLREMEDRLRWARVHRATGDRTAAHTPVWLRPDGSRRPFVPPPGQS